MDLQREKPPASTQGETLYHFLDWCASTGRMPRARENIGDPFYLSDEELDRLWQEYRHHLAETRQSGMRFG